MMGGSVVIVLVEMGINEIVLEILLQHCSRRSQIVCYNVAIESPIQSKRSTLSTVFRLEIT
jgi:hypothetical protein